MNPILAHPLFASMVSEQAQKCLKQSKLKCDFCSFTGTDPDNFDEDKRTCSRCQNYLEAMRIYGMDMDDISKRFGLLGSIRALETSIGICAPTSSILMSFKSFFTKLRAIPEIKKAISEGMENERKKKDNGSSD